MKDCFFVRKDEYVKLWKAKKRSYYDSMNVDFMKQLLTGEMIKKEEQKITETRFKISMAKIRKEMGSNPVKESEVLDAVEDLLFGPGGVLI
jgi:hypothetical protein